MLTYISACAVRRSAPRAHRPVWRDHDPVPDMNAPVQNAVTSDKDSPLRDDIRLLGRILGDTLREQEGEATFDLIERTRQNAIRFRRDRDPEAKRELEAMLNKLDPVRTIGAQAICAHAGKLA